VLADELLQHLCGEETLISAGPERCVKMPLWRLAKEEWAAYEEGSHDAVVAALGRLPADAAPSVRLQAVEEALMALVRTLLPDRSEPVAVVPSLACGSW